MYLLEELTSFHCGLLWQDSVHIKEFKIHPFLSLCLSVQSTPNNVHICLPGFRAILLSIR